MSQFICNYHFGITNLSFVISACKSASNLNKSFSYCSDAFKFQVASHDRNQVGHSGKYKRLIVVIRIHA